MIINRPIGSLAIKNSGKKVYFKLRKPWEFSINLKIPLKTSIVQLFWRNHSNFQWFWRNSSPLNCFGYSDFGYSQVALFILEIS